MNLGDRATVPAGESVTRKRAASGKGIVTAAVIGIRTTSQAGVHTVTETMTAETGIETGIGIGIGNETRRKTEIERSATASAIAIATENTATGAAINHLTSHPRRGSPRPRT